MFCPVAPYQPQAMTNSLVGLLCHQGIFIRQQSFIFHNICFSYMTNFKHKHFCHQVFTSLFDKLSIFLYDMFLPFVHVCKLCGSTLWFIIFCFVLCVDGQSTILENLAKRLGADVVLGCSDKVSQLDAWRKEKGLEWTQVAFIGRLLIHYWQEHIKLLLTNVLSRNGNRKKWQQRKINEYPSWRQMEWQWWRMKQECCFLISIRM